MQKSLNDLTEADLTILKDCAALFFSPGDIAKMLEAKKDDIELEISEYGVSGPVYNAFWAGRMQGELDLRTSLMKMAKAGSTPAQAMMMELLKLSKMKMIGK